MIKKRTCAANEFGPSPLMPTPNFFGDRVRKSNHNALTPHRPHPLPFFEAQRPPSDHAPEARLQDEDGVAPAARLVHLRPAARPQRGPHPEARQELLCGGELQRGCADQDARAVLRCQRSGAARRRPSGARATPTQPPSNNAHASARCLPLHTLLNKRLRMSIVPPPLGNILPKSGPIWSKSGQSRGQTYQL